MRPVGLARATKDNSRKLHNNHAEWMTAKKIGRQRQVWVWDGHEYEKWNAGLPPVGHWEKVVSNG